MAVVQVGLPMLAPVDESGPDLATFRLQVQGLESRSTLVFVGFRVVCVDSVPVPATLPMELFVGPMVSMPMTAPFLFLGSYAECRHWLSDKVL